MKVFKRKISSNGDVLQFVVYRLPQIDGVPRCEFRLEKLSRYRGSIWVTVFHSKEFFNYSAQYSFDNADTLFSAFLEKFETDFRMESEAMDVADAMNAMDEVLIKTPQMKQA